MKMQKSKRLVLGLCICALLSGCSDQGSVLLNSSDSLVGQDVSSGISSSAKIRFTTDTPPVWAQEAESIMADLEEWRGKRFTQDLVIHIKPREPGEPAGWYNPQTKQLVVTEDGSNQFKRGVMLHEIFHALQDQTFNLVRLHQAAQSPDADQAIDALIEGEAMLAVSDLMQYDFAAHAKLPAAGKVSDERFNRLFEYGDGMKFVRKLREEGGWAKIDQVFQTPPQSTQAIYHPQQFLSDVVSPTSQDIGEYGFRLWLARDPEARSHLATLQNAYQSDELISSSEGEYAWTIQLDSEANAQLVRDLAPNAIAQMPNAPATYTVEQNQAQVIVQWSDPSSS